MTAAMPRGFAAFGCVLALLVGSAVAATLPVPALTARVTDQTGTLDAGQVQALEATLASFEQSKGSQIAILIVPTTGDETIAQYAIRVVDAWKLGRKGVDDGVLVLVAKGDRKVRIEVGRGLEGVIPDAIANRIIDEDVVPQFKAGDFAGGLQAGVARLIGLANGEPLPAPNPQRSDGRARSGDAPFFGALIAFLIARIVFSALKPFVRGLATGGVVGTIALLVGAAFGFATMLALFGFILGVMSNTGGRSAGGGGWGGWGGGGGGWGGGSSGGGGFSGGGFSGGGGGFSGGGASGGW